MLSAYTNQRPFSSRCRGRPDAIMPAGTRRMENRNHHQAKLLLLFIDGLGLGKPDPAINPLTQDGLRVLSSLRWLLDGPVSVPGLFGACPVDATLGVPGIPQSGTGQTSLFTGINAAAAAGRHVNGFPTRQLREIIRQESIFLKLARAGLTGNFANAFTPRLPPFYQQRRLSVTTWATLAGGRPLATLHDLASHRSVYQDFTNLHLIDQGYPVQLQRAAGAGRVLASLAPRQDFLLYEYFLTDHAGHAGDLAFARLIVRLLDEFLAALLESLDLSRITVLLVSDHGNIEDLSRKPHTRNPVPLLAWGPGCHWFPARVQSLPDVTPAIMDFLTGPPVYPDRISGTSRPGRAGHLAKE